MSNLLKKEKGFTLIEIVLVLAIAGLLLVIVFLAVSGAQKSRRDTQRKNDLSRIAANLETYAGNNNGAYPLNAAFATAFAAGGQYYLGATTVDPLSGSTYLYGSGVAAPAAPTTTTGAGVVYNLVSPRVYNVCIGLEQGTSTCRTNQ